MRAHAAVRSREWPARWHRSRRRAPVNLAHILGLEDDSGRQLVVGEGAAEGIPKKVLRTARVFCLMTPIRDSSNVLQQG